MTELKIITSNSVL